MFYPPVHLHEIHDWRIPLNTNLQRFHAELLALEPEEPPPPWTGMRHIHVGGVFAGGWTAQGHVLLLSGDGYSLTDAVSGERLARNRNSNAGLLENPLLFTLPPSGEQVPIFGVNGGCSILRAEDAWQLERLNPVWPKEMVLLWEPKRRFWRPESTAPYFDCAHALAFGRHLGGDLVGCSFSPANDQFMLLAGDGALIYWCE